MAKITTNIDLQDISSIGSQNLQQVTDIGNTTTNTIVVNPPLGTSDKGLVINSETSSTGNPIEINKNGINKLTINQQGELSIIKIPGGLSNQFLMADGSVSTGGSGGSQNLQQVLDIGNTTDTSIIMNIANTQGILINLSEYSVGFNVSTIAGANLSYPILFNNDYATYFQVDNGGNLLSLGSLEAYSFVKSGGLATEYLMADGSVTTGSPGSGGSIPHGTASGTDTYTVTITGVTSYVDGDAYLIRFTNGNTTGSTININGLGARNLYRNNDGPLIGGDVTAGGEMLCVYNSTTNTFQCIGTSPNSLFAYVTNADLVTITKGQPVYAFSGTGDRMTVKRAKNTGDSTSAQTVGLVMSSSIAAGQKGIIMMQGLLDGLSILPTSTWVDGDPVYLGDTDGSITKVKPHAPNHLVYLGVVTTASNGSAGRMYVRIQNGYELDELHNVQAQSPALKDTLYYDNTVTPGQWKTASLSTILGYTPANDLNVVHLSGTETITGLKTFTGGINVVLSGNAIRANSGQALALDVIGGNNGNAIGKFTRVTDNVEVVRIDNNGLKLQLETINTIAGIDSNKNIISLPTTTYPSLVELTYVKGVTSAIQTQLNGKITDPITLKFNGDLLQWDSPTSQWKSNSVIINDTDFASTANVYCSTLVDTLLASIQTQVDNKIAKNVATTYTTNIITTVTAAEYAAIGTKDPNTLYFII